MGLFFKLIIDICLSVIVMIAAQVILWAKIKRRNCTMHNLVRLRWSFYSILIGILFFSMFSVTIATCSYLLLFFLLRRIIFFNDTKSLESLANDAHNEIKKFKFSLLFCTIEKKPGKLKNKNTDRDFFYPLSIHLNGVCVLPFLYVFDIVNLNNSNVSIYSIEYFVLICAFFIIFAKSWFEIKKDNTGLVCGWEPWVDIVIWGFCYYVIAFYVLFLIVKIKFT